jgi:hypothetical protein
MDVDLKGETNKWKDWTNKWTYEQNGCIPSMGE